MTVERHRDRLRDLHDIVERDGVFVSTTSRTLVEARRVSRRSSTA